MKDELASGAVLAGAGILSFLAYKLGWFSTGSIPTAISTGINSLSHTVGEKIWQAPYKANSSGLTGFKKFHYSPLGEVADWLTHFTPDIRYKPTDKANEIGKSGTWWIPAGSNLYNSNGKAITHLTGDPRALFTLARLWADIDTEPVASLGMFVWQPGTTDTTHDYGHAIDLAPLHGDVTSLNMVMNRLVTAAISRNCPIAWISPYQSKGKSTWPMFQVRNGVKVEFSYSKQNHSNPFHYHLVLPRPEIGLNFAKVI